MLWFDYVDWMRYDITAGLPDTQMGLVVSQLRLDVRRVMGDKETQLTDLYPIIPDQERNDDIDGKKILEFFGNVVVQESDDKTSEE